MYVLSVTKSAVVISDAVFRQTTINSAAHLEEFLGAEAKRLGLRVRDLQIYNSSTMDFPHDSTDDPAVITLAKELR